MAKLTPEEALRRIVATSQKGKKKAKSVVQYKHVKTLGLANDALFVFQKGGTKQHILTPADDRLVPIIAEIEEANFDEELPPCFIDWAGEYERELAWYDTMGATVTDDYSAPKNRKNIPYMLKTKWAQTDPYNMNLDFGNGACKVGCAALATGQIMYYWRKYHRGCKATKAYITTTNKYKVAALRAVTSFDYANMTESNPKTTASKKAIANFLEHLGKAMQADYTPSGTGVPPKVMTAVLKDVLKMGKDIKMIFASNGAAIFEEAIYQELANGRAVIMSGYHTNGGHAFVCDGYRVSDNKFHFNWGWGGSYNGWYAMSALNPTAANTYNSNKIATIGIKPDYLYGDVNNDGDVNITDVMEIGQQILGKKPMTEAADVNNDGEVTTTDQQELVKYILGR
jgi:hypothetical protein